MNTARISVVVVAWNAGSSLDACVEALRASARLAGEELQFVVIDNASQDDAVAQCDLTEDDVVVRNPLNAGYGVAAAQGIARAESPWILLVNPDVVVEPGFVGAIADAADRARATVGVLVPELRFASRPDIVNCRGLAVDEIGVPAEIDAGRHIASAQAPSLPLAGGSSGCCLLRADHLVRLGGPEPSFFAYLEDVDLALRLRRAGYDSVFVPGAVALHEGSAFTGAQSPLKVFLVARNRRVLFRLHGPWSIRARAWRTLVEIGHACYASTGTPVAPWSGRFHAVGLRRHSTFLRRARAKHEPCVASLELAPRAGFRETLRRKQRVTELH